MQAQQLVLSEGKQERHIGGIATTGDQHPTAAGEVVAGIEDVPAIGQKGLEPGGEINGGFAYGNAGVTEVAGAIAGWDIEAAAEGDGEMGKVPACLLYTSPSPRDS